MKRRWLAIPGTLILLLATGTIGLKWYATRLAETKTAALEARISPYLGCQHGPSTYDLLTGTLRISDVRTTGIAGKSVWTIREVVVKKFDYDNKVPNFASVIISGLNVDLPQGGLKSLAGFLHQYGLQSPELNVSLDYRYTVPDKILTIDEVAIEGVGLATVSGSMVLSNIEWPMMDNFLAAIMAIWQTRLLEARIQFSDHALCNRVLEHLAASTSQSRQEVINMLIGKIAVIVNEKQVVSNSDIPAEAAKFLGKPNKLTLSVSPAQPLALTSIRSLPMRDLSRLLKLELKAQ
jgi:hypothetical protein